MKESHGDEDARTEKERQTKEEVVGLHQGRHGGTVGASPEDTQDKKRWRRLVHMAATPQP